MRNPAGFGIQTREDRPGATSDFIALLRFGQAIKAMNSDYLAPFGTVEWLGKADATSAVYAQRDGVLQGLVMALRQEGLRDLIDFCGQWERSSKVAA